MGEETSGECVDEREDYALNIWICYTYISSGLIVGVMMGV